MLATRRGSGIAATVEAKEARDGTTGVATGAHDDVACMVDSLCGTRMRPAHPSSPTSPLPASSLTPKPCIAHDDVLTVAGPNPRLPPRPHLQRGDHCDPCATPVTKGANHRRCSMTSMLEVVDLNVHFSTSRGPVKAVDGVSFAVDPGERLGLIGESGSGKSTIALATMRLIKAPGRIVSGRILLDGVDLLALTDEEMRRQRLAKIALVTQGAMNSLNPVLRIRPQIIDGMTAHGIRLTKREGEARVTELLHSVDLSPDVADLYPHQLSGGMKQRVCIAAAICLGPKVIIADEPTSALDVVVQKRVMETLRRVQDELGAAVILIGHDIGLMAHFAQRVAVMRGGRLLEMNGVKEIFAHPNHPYTRLLMDSLPTFNREDSFLATASLTAARLASARNDAS